MQTFFDPKSVAVIGVPSRTGVGSFNNVETMLRYGYKGRIYPINPKADEICGLKAYPSVLDIPEPAELAVISVGRDRVMPLFQQCIQIGIKRVVIISQGFSDADQIGTDLQEQIVSLAKENGVRIVGPNTMGLMNNYNRFTTGFVDLPVPEKFSPVSLIAQTGYIQIASVDYSYNGFGKAIDIGNTSDVDFADAIEYFGEDPETEVIAIHMEGMKRGQTFLEIASGVTLKKPIVVLKTGRSRFGAQAALSHTGSLVGEDAVFDAAFEMAGVIRARDTIDFKDALKALACFGEMAGPNIAVITVTGAGGIMAIDVCEEEGLKLAKLPQGLSEKLREGVPEWLHVGNPIDIWPIGMIGGDYPGAVDTALTALLQSPDVDGIVLIIPAMNSPLHLDIADLSGVVSEVRNKVGNKKPIAAFLYADEEVEYPEKYEAVDAVGSFASAEQCVRALSVCYQYHKSRTRQLPSVREFGIDSKRADILLEKGRKDKALTGEDALGLLEAYGIPVAKGIIAKNWNGLETAAKKLEYPLVLKLAGSRFLHKSEWGGVKTGIATIDDLRVAFHEMSENVRRVDPTAEIECFQLQEQAMGRELLLGLKRDPQFGHVIACGMGGIYTEVFRDVSRAIVPIDCSGAEKMIKSLKMYPLLKGVRGEAPADVGTLLDILERLSYLALSVGDISELDVNPLMVSENGCTAVDGRILW
ncbi:MAG: acetate--CoA ligase family protein [Deltaproteobacteria bacterium]|nr:acetate--CoA ligase family protein [Deltaproteobacteria bacterium]